MVRIFLSTFLLFSSISLADEICSPNKILSEVKPEYEFLYRNSCSILTSTPDCKKLYKEIIQAGKDINDYRPDCYLNQDSAFSKNVLDLGQAYLGCYVGVFRETFGELGTILGETAAKIVTDFEVNQICDSQVKFKRLLYESYNESNNDELKIPIPSDQKLNNYSCRLIRQAILEESRYLKVKLQRVQGSNRLKNNDGDSVEIMARKKLTQMGIELQCYNSRKQSELICGAAS